MALKPPKRLPRRFNRSASPATRSLVHTFYGGPKRARRRRHERMIRFGRRANRFFLVAASEFRLWFLIGIGGVTLAIAAILLFAPFFDVRELHVRRQDPRIDPEEVQAVLSPLFKQRLVLVTRGQVESLLMDTYPDIEKVEISKEYPSALTVTVFLEPVVASVRREEEVQQETGAGSGALVPVAAPVSGYMYITRKGYFVSSPIPLKTEALQKLTITDFDEEPRNRSLLLSPEFLESVFLARDTLRRDFGLDSLRIVIYLRAQEFHIRTPKTTLWFDLRSPLPVQFGRFREFLKASSIDQAKEYIDLRISDKIIYK